MPRDSLTPQNIMRVMSDVSRIRDSLTDAAGKLDVDVEEFLFVLEHDTDLMGILDRYEELISMKRDYATRAKARAQQLERQAEAGRVAFLAILTALETKKLERPTYTASVTKGPQSLFIDAPEAIPFGYLIPVPDRPAITKALKAGETVEGAHLTDAKPVLRITRGKAQDAEEVSNGQ